MERKGFGKKYKGCQSMDVRSMVW